MSWRWWIYGRSGHFRNAQLEQICCPSARLQVCESVNRSATCLMWLKIEACHGAVVFSESFGYRECLDVKVGKLVSGIGCV
jgi:hypothetical protein